MNKKISPAIFGIALICFFLPWVNVSCQGQKVMTLSGIELVTGTTVSEPRMFGPPRTIKVPGETLAALALVAVIIGGILSLFKGQIGVKGPAVVGGLGTILLLLLKSKMDDDILKQSQGVLQISYEMGFYLTLVLFISAVALNVYSIMQSRGLPLPQNARQGTASNFCSQCGAKVESGATFCSECGKAVK